MEELLRFMALARVDHRLGPAHVSLYVALVCLKREMGVEGVFSVGRKEGMERSRILGKERYYRCLRELAEMGYIGYEPQFYPGKGSRLWIGENVICQSNYKLSYGSKQTPPTQPPPHTAGMGQGP